MFGRDNSPPNPWWKILDPHKWQQYGEVDMIKRLDSLQLPFLNICPAICRLIFHNNNHSNNNNTNSDSNIYIIYIIYILYIYHMLDRFNPHFPLATTWFNNSRKPYIFCGLSYSWAACTITSPCFSLQQLSAAPG